ncbi:hypothetical protein Drorol1_Dr00024650 [Drosera rotundifolia]
MLQQLEKSKALLHLDEERIASTSQITGISDLCFGFEPRFVAISSRTSMKPMGNVEHHGKIRGVGLPRPREEERKAAENWSELKGRMRANQRGLGDQRLQMHQAPGLLLFSSRSALFSGQRQLPRSRFLALLAPLSSVSPFAQSLVLGVRIYARLPFLDLNFDTLVLSVGWNSSLLESVEFVLFLKCGFGCGRACVLGRGKCARYGPYGCMTTIFLVLWGLGYVLSYFGGLRESSF